MTNRVSGTISAYRPRVQWSRPSGERMQISNTPPTRNSMRASGTVYPAGQNQCLKCSAELHAWNTSLRGAGNRRDTISGSGSPSDFLLDAAITASSFIQCLQILFQAVEVPLPVQPPLVYPLLRLTQGFEINPTGANASGLLRSDQTRLFEHAKMLHNRGKGHGQWSRQFADRAWRSSQRSQNRPPSGIGESLKCPIE